MHSEPTASRSLEALVRVVLRRRWLVALAWTILLAASLVASLHLSDLLSNRYRIPDSGSDRVNQVLDEQYGQLTDGVFQVVVRASDPTDPASLLAAADRAAAAAAKELPRSGTQPAAPAGEQLAVAVVTTRLEQADSKLYVEQMREAISSELRGSSVDTWVTGPGAIAADLDPILAEDLERGEFKLALPIALVIVAIVFGSMGMLVPFLFALFSIPVSLGVVWIFANVMDLSSFVLNMVVGIGLGISIDYSLIMYWRYREERLGADGEIDNSMASRRQAVLNTMLTAGRAVVFSGLAVAIGLSVLLLMPLPFMRGFGVAGLVIPLVSIVAALTLMPVLLYSFAHRLERFRFISARRMRSRDRVDGSGWARFAAFVMRRPWTIFLASAAILITMTVPALQTSVLPGSNAGIPTELESIEGQELVDDALGRGTVTPAIVMFDAGTQDGARDPEVLAAARRLVEQASADAEVRRVSDPAAPTALDATGRYLRVDVTGRHDYGHERSSELVHRLRDRYVDEADVPAGVRVDVGGAPAIGVDLIDTTYRIFPWLVALVLALTYVLLLRAFRSLLLPLKAIILNLLSIGAAFGLLHLVFTTSIAERVGLVPAEQIEFWIPVFLFAMLFGLSMDYEVFLVARMREGWDETHDNEQAVQLGLARTGRLVTAAGLIMVAAFGGFLLSRPVGFQQFGLGLASAVLIDVTLVRALLLPSAMKLFGRWNWWLPAWTARLVRVEPSPLDPPATRAASAPTTG